MRWMTTAEDLAVLEELEEAEEDYEEPEEVRLCCMCGCVTLSCDLLYISIQKSFSVNRSWA